MRTLKVHSSQRTIRGFHSKYFSSSLSSCDPCFFPEEEFEAKSLCEKFFGRVLHPHEFAALCGCSPTDILQTVVGTNQHRLYLEFHAKDADCVGTCLIDADSNSRLVLFNEHVRFLNQEKLGRRKFQWFSKQKKACERLGISAVHMLAAKSSISQGYRYYPLMGFNADLPQDFRRRFLPDDYNTQTLHDLLDKPDFWNLWITLGTQIEVTFEMKPYSRSQMIFNQNFIP